jgi:hypothetical protein
MAQHSWKVTTFTTGRLRAWLRYNLRRLWEAFWGTKPATTTTVMVLWQTFIPGEDDEKLIAFRTKYERPG